MLQEESSCSSLFSLRYLRATSTIAREDLVQLILGHMLDEGKGIYGCG